MGGQPRVTGRTRQGRPDLECRVSGWGPKLELAKQKSSDRRGRRGIKLRSMAQHRTCASCAVHASRGKWPGTRVPRYIEAPRPGSQALSQPTPLLPPPPPRARWSRLWLSLACCAQCLCFINRPSRRSSAVCRNARTMTLDGWARRLFGSSMRAPCPVGRGLLRLQVPPPAANVAPPAMGPSFMHCTCHELTLRQPAPKPALERLPRLLRSSWAP